MATKVPSVETLYSAITHLPEWKIKKLYAKLEKFMKSKYKEIK